MNETELSGLFARLGARCPDAWARSQINEDIPQLARFLFLRQAWKLIVDPDETGWIKKEALKETDSPGGAIGPALKRVLAQGASESDLTAIVRTMQWELLFGLCYLLDDPGPLEPEARDIAWRLFQVDQNDRPLAIIGGLHESVLETDPTGKEMRV